MGPKSVPVDPRAWALPRLTIPLQKYFPISHASSKSIKWFSVVTVREICH